MAGEQESTAEERAIDALTKILESAISPDMLEAQQIILRRLALSGDLFPSRIPPPLNITQVGGYFNLLETHPEMREQVLASALGVAGPNPSLGWEPVLPGLFFAGRPNHRPEGSSQAAIPVHFAVRSDFAEALDAARATIERHGCALPILSASRHMPRAGVGVQPPDELLPFVGRVLELVPATALVDPATDPLAVGEPVAGGPRQVVARQLDNTAPDAAAVAAADWDLWTCDATTCTESTVNGAYLPLTPILNAAGWHQQAPAAPTSATATGGWHRWTNVTGLVAGTSRFGEELSLLYTTGEVARSSVRERLDWVWNGTTFVSPGP